MVVTSSVCLTLSAHGSPIEYIFSGTGVSGVLGDQEFNDAKFVINIFGDTDNADTDILGPVIADPEDGTILNGTISLFGGDLQNSYSGDLLDFLYVFVYPVDQITDLGGVGFGTNYVSDPVDQFALYASGVGLFTYDLRSPFGPVQGTSINNSFDTLTSFGSLAFEDVENASFQAVPEPASVLLLSFGLLGLLGFRRKLQK